MGFVGFFFFFALFYGGRVGVFWVLVWLYVEGWVYIEIWLKDGN